MWPDLFPEDSTPLSGSGLPANVGTPGDVERSRQTDPIETARVSIPGRIAEIGPALRKGVGADRRPDGVGKGRGGVHDHGGVGGPGNPETELVGLDTEGGGVGQDDGGWEHPKSSGTTGKGCVPTGGAREITNSDVSGSVEHG